MILILILILKLYKVHLDKRVLLIWTWLSTIFFHASLSGGLQDEPVMKPYLCGLIEETETHAFVLFL